MLNIKGLSLTLKSTKLGIIKFEMFADKRKNPNFFAWLKILSHQ